jgi:isopentenyl-diphosphate Delta-isomerase
VVRQSRKLDHIKFAVQLDDGPLASGFADLAIVPNCLPGLCWDDIDVSTTLVGMPLAQPVIINAITGGAADVANINASLAEFARLTGCIMAVGSQYAALEDPTVRESYQIIRKKNPAGQVLANVGAHATLDQACRAVDMVQACAIQIHLNVAQELIMAEGDRTFAGYLENIYEIAARVGVPAIAKEVGCGIAREQAQMLTATGIRGIDVGGAGGTNFLAIEAARREIALSQETLRWGIPTVISTLEVAAAIPDFTDLIVSGGVRSPLDVVKALSLGGRAVGIAGPIVRSLQEQGLEATVMWFQQFIEDIKRYMILAGAMNIKVLQQVPIVITGYSREWCLARQIDITKYATRKHG